MSQASQLFSKTLVAFAALAGTVSAAHADPITYIVIGTIGPTGIDGGGYFGPAGSSIVGLPFTVTWTANDCECIGTNQPNLKSVYPDPNPILEVTLAIKDYTYDFGGGGWGGMFKTIDGYPMLEANYLDGDSVFTASDHGNLYGTFRIEGNASFSSGLTVGAFSPPVPGPIVGTGPSALLALAIIVLLRSSRLRYRLHDVYPQHRSQ